MKVRITTVGKNISVDIEEEKATCVFNNLALQLLGVESKERKENRKHQDSQKVDVAESVLSPVPKQEKLLGEPTSEKTSMVENYQDIIPGGPYQYKGFMYLKCPSCGAVKGFCSKGYLKEFHCESCGTDTGFTEELKPLYVNCICGGKFKYLTNMNIDMFDINCINCGNPVAVNWNKKKQVYETIK